MSGAKENETKRNEKGNQSMKADKWSFFLHLIGQLNKMIEIFFSTHFINDENVKSW